MAMFPNQSTDNRKVRTNSSQSRSHELFALYLINSFLYDQLGMRGRNTSLFLQIIHVVGSFMRIWSVYSVYYYLTQTKSSFSMFIFVCMVPSSIIFLSLQKPWKGKSLSNTQIVPSVINGGIMSIYFILWGNGLLTCGPVRALMAEYSGALLGVLSAALYGRNRRIWKKVSGLIAMLISFYLLSQGWYMTTRSPLSFKGNYGSSVHEEHGMGMNKMAIPIMAGIFSALRRVIARRVALKNQLKSRLHALSAATATICLMPVAVLDSVWESSRVDAIVFPSSAWPYLSMSLFGIVLISYVDNVAEERLHMVFSSPRQMIVAGGCIIIMEIVYKSDFSLLGYIICSVLLGYGIHQATSLDHYRKGASQKPEFMLIDSVTDALEDDAKMYSLPT